MRNNRNNTFFFGGLGFFMKFYRFKKKSDDRECFDISGFEICREDKTSDIILTGNEIKEGLRWNAAPVHLLTI